MLLCGCDVCTATPAWNQGVQITRCIHLADLVLYWCCRCVLHIEPHGPKRGLVKRVLHKARHPRSNGTKHDQLVGEVLRLPASGSKKGPVVLDTCEGTWLTDLTWDKVGSNRM